MRTAFRQRAALAARIAAGLTLLLAIACGSDDERAREHLERAGEFLASGRRADAVIELQNALVRDPESYEAHSRLAKIEIERGRLEAAVSHIREAYRLAPQNSEAALRLASVLQGDQPKQAEVLIEVVISREPENPAGYVARSNLALVRGQIQQGLTAARRAMEVAPNDPVGDWQYGTALMAKIRERQLTDEVPEDKVYKTALAAFGRYIAKNGPESWKAQLEQARVLAAWEGSSREAARLFRVVVESTVELPDGTAQQASAAQAASFAISVGDDDLLDFSLEKLVAARPDNFEAWRSLARLRARRGGNADEVIRQLVEKLPQDPRSHTEYARLLISQYRLEDALAYLEEKAKDENLDPPALLGAIANTQLAAQRPEDARRTIERLEREYPRHPRSVLERAQLDLREGRVADAKAALRRLVVRHASADAYRLLARAEEASGSRRGAIRSITKAIELTEGFALGDQRIRARLLAAIGNCKGAIPNLVEIRRRTPLGDEETISLARCRYETNQQRFGRRALEKLLARPAPPASAVIEYARREGLDKTRGQMAHQHLEALVAGSPHDWDAIRELTRIDLAHKRDGEALARLDRAIRSSGKKTPAKARLLRARARASVGKKEGALFDAKAAFETEPRLRGALELLVSLYVDQDELEAAVSALEEAGRARALDADRHFLLGRLYQREGRNRKALRAFESALAAGGDHPALKNDLAYLLATQGRQLKRALQMAREAKDQLQNDPNAIDTLGFVYLKSGKIDTALSHFEEAVARSETPQPSFYYHLGLALRSLDRSNEATKAFEQALSLDANFPEATDALRELKGARSAGAS